MKKQTIQSVKIIILGLTIGLGAFIASATYTFTPPITPAGIVSPSLLTQEPEDQIKVGSLGVKAFYVTPFSADFLGNLTVGFLGFSGNSLFVGYDVNGNIVPGGGSETAQNIIITDLHNGGSTNQNLCVDSAGNLIKCPPNYTLTVQRTGGSGGNYIIGDKYAPGTTAEQATTSSGVTSSPSILCYAGSNVCTDNDFPSFGPLKNKVVALYAAGSNFSSWTPSCSTPLPNSGCLITMNAPKTITANFTVPLVVCNNSDSPKTFSYTQTWTMPTNCHSATFVAHGAGGGGAGGGGGIAGLDGGNGKGAGGGGGGGAGAEISQTVNDNPYTAYTITIGAGGGFGSGGQYGRGNWGGSGGSTSVTGGSANLIAAGGASGRPGCSNHGADGNCGTVSNAVISSGGPGGTIGGEAGNAGDSSSIGGRGGIGGGCTNFNGGSGGYNDNGGSGVICPDTGAGGGGGGGGRNNGPSPHSGGNGGAGSLGYVTVTWY